ncbi:phosphoglucosamine mutase [Hippea maritima]|uniref:Phosphoglucosamine mutase n=1 Tax=Hippea maritima (strain ATCC 700847 / DSM 10411 / MH2) TaxID=760142 RepID=F2LUJ4_HIPMA|nr:phosphoglucosamine mutase [Hippea maritima]AEA34584.1 phosphoglucosamine mutase [Hippea maritima DSM 10411]
MKLFGTDGIRGKANTYPMVGDVAYKLGKALVYALDGKTDRKRKIIIGKDTRLSGYMLESAITSGVVSMGADAYLVGPMPTPAIAFLVRSMRGDAGVVISASHNPYDDNGIKIFSKDGLKLDDKLEDLIEKLILTDKLNNMGAVGDKIGRAYRIRDTLGRYIVFAKDTLPYSVSLDGLRVVLDCANGATYKVAPMIFEELGAEVIAINNQPNGININDKCGSTYPKAIVDATKLYRADVGIAFDGDGDRVLMVDDRYNIVDGDAILAILARYMKKRNTLKGDKVVGTVMTNYGLEMFLDKLGISLQRVDVGDKNIVKKIMDENLNLGGEQSGHIVLWDFNTTGDGIVTALAILSIMKQENARLSELTQDFRKIPQKTVNVLVKEKPQLEEVEEIQNAITKAKEKLSKNGRIVVRYSGTEPLLRITVESFEAALVDECLNLVSNAAVKSIGGKP